MARTWDGREMGWQGAGVAGSWGSGFLQSRMAGSDAFLSPYGNKSETNLPSSPIFIFKLKTPTPSRTGASNSKRTDDLTSFNQQT